MIQNARDNRVGTLGTNSYDVPSRLGSNRTIENNAPEVGRHNCTSWICSAPVGANRESIIELAGAAESYDIHTSPSWWQMWLRVFGKTDRNVFNIYWSDKAIDQAEENLMREWHKPFVRPPN